MKSAYRKALELISKGWNFLRALAYIEKLFPKDNPAELHRATTAAYSGSEIAKWMQEHEGETITNGFRGNKSVVYRPFENYTPDELRAIFPQLVNGPYEVEIITDIAGVNQSGYQSWRVRIGEGDTWLDILEDIAEQISEEYEWEGKITQEIVAKVVVGFVI